MRDILQDKWTARFKNVKVKKDKERPGAVLDERRLKETRQLSFMHDSGLDPGLENENNLKDYHWDNRQMVNMVCGLGSSIESVLKFLILIIDCVRECSYS